ncbi:hypothetical protein BO94DRAFT_517533 [Aspergillus sclerotioniger CBS 115572]|uniref:HDA1 complex subunit n=1 Tax=Aspergillus sclerotioniger CBS 115572 TaxID=1450535 RepID=A0A317WK43_9EURO|nr:hypothetical protein BO94DRAFT_517533 [Aspergillus sclerotioniger CBS 115572]PWY86435.1 hypothetical protein BO94DRAFT_517533 [Aspergillus sclerotioniger CBS 115572]
MWRKRKVPSPIYTGHPSDTRRQRWKEQHVIQTSEDEDQTEDNTEALDADEWYINCILDETESQYLIDWEGPWTPTWEPKEHASELAVQAWEDRKQRDRTLQKEPDQSNTPPPPPLSDAREHSIEPLNPGPNQPEIKAPTDEPRPRKPSVSPLFVPRDTIPESPIDPGVVPISSSNPGVLEYDAAFTIPPELRLPDEVEETSITPYPAETLLCTENTDGLEVSERTPEPPHDISSSLSGAQSAVETLSTNPVEAVDEIPETPAGPVAEPETQQSCVVSTFPGIGLQNTGSSIGSRAIPGTGLSPSLVFPCSLPAENTIPRRASIVSESVAAGTSQTTSEQPSQDPSTFWKYPTRPRITMDTPEKKTVPSLSETMDKYSHFEGSTPREKLRNAYAQLRVKANPGPDASGTPSSAEDIEPSAPVSLPETAPPLSVRVDKEPTHHTDTEANPATTMPTVEPVEMGLPEHSHVQTIQPSALSVNYTEESTPGSVHLGPSEFAVPLPMDSRIKDDYERVLTSESQSIRDFLDMTGTQSDTEYQGPLTSKMREVLERLSNISTHPDLNIVEHIKESESELGREAAWAEYSSAKFLLLSYLLDAASMRDMHLVIMVQGEKTRRVVERYLMGKGLSYTRPRPEMGSGTNIEVSMVRDSLSFGIQTTRNDGIVETYKAPAAIIALDTSFNTKSPTVEHMRTTFARNGNLLPVVRLLVSNSSEHIELCFPNLPEIERIRLLLQYSIRLRDVVGDLQDDALGVQEDAEELLSCLESDNFSAHWPLPHIEPLRILSPEQLASTHQELQSRPGIDIPSVTTPQIQKRAFAEDGTEPSSKRPRMEESLETSQFTESTKIPNQPLDGELQSLEENLVQMKNSHATENERLQKLLKAAQTRLQEREHVLNKLQHRYESRNREFHKLRREHERLTQAKATADQRVEKQKEELMKLKDERTQLRHDLEEARETLKAGGGTTAELESAKEEIRRLTKDNAALERKADYEARQAEYTREQYQTASTVAAQSGNELRQLRDENETLKRKVAGDATQLRELNQKNDEARHLSRVLELESTLTSREDLLRRKEEELREIRKNRPSTRSTSTQPRSPKWTAGNSRPTSPGINNGSSLAGRGSALRFSSEMPL